MEKQPKHKSILGKKRKRKASVTISSEPKIIKVAAAAKLAPDSPTQPAKKKENKKKKAKVTESEPEPVDAVVTVAGPPKPNKLNASAQKTSLPSVKFQGLSVDEIGEKYPIFKDTTLIERFLKVALNNNQKGRIRQAIKSQLQDSDNNLSADIIHGKIQAILKGSENLTDSDLRRLRILYNMLKTTLEQKEDKPQTEKKKKMKAKKVKKEKGEEEDKEPKKEKEQLKKKVKGPKRYVVFIGNLPLDVDKENLMKHFSEIDESIKDIRIPPLAEGKKSAIAFMELASEPTYEMALSKHHSMLNNRRINVMYTAQEKGKVSKSEAKGKAAKLVALQKSGKLTGSTAANKKRSHRRNIMKRAQAKQTAAENA